VTDMLKNAGMAVPEKAPLAVQHDNQQYTLPSDVPTDANE